MRLTSAPPNFILGTWICEAGVSGPDCRTGACGAPGGMLACDAPACASKADVTPVKPATSPAPDCRKFLREFDMAVTSLGHSVIRFEVAPVCRISWSGSRAMSLASSLYPEARIAALRLAKQIQLDLCLSPSLLTLTPSNPLWAAR